MAKATITTSLSVFNRSVLMRRAWDLFVQIYGYGPKGRGIPFKSIGRSCFAYCVRRAWEEVKSRAAVLAIPAQKRTEMIANLRGELEGLRYLPFGMSVSARADKINAQIAQLSV